MVGVNGRIPMGSRILMASDVGGGFSSETPSFDDVVFGFLESEGSFESVDTYDFDDEEEQNENSVDHVKKNKAFWESQHQLLQVSF